MTVPVDQPDWGNPQSGMSVYAPVLASVSIAPSASQGPFDLSAYSSYTMWLSTASFNGANIAVTDPDSGRSLWALTTPPDGLGTAGVPMRAPVTTKRIQITNAGTETLTVNLSAASRTSTGPPSAFSIADSDNLSRANAAVAGTIDLSYGHGFGDAWCFLGVSGAVVLGSFAIRSGPDVYDVADTAEMHTNPFGGRSIYKQITLPRGVWALEWHTQTGGNAALNAHFVYSG